MILSVTITKILEMYILETCSVHQLVSSLKTTQMIDRGVMLHEGMVVPGSNVVDLVHDLLRKRKTSDPIG